METRQKFLILVVVSVWLSSPLLSVYGSPKFHHTYRDAVVEASREKKPLIVILSADWCPPCQMMKRTVYPSAEVQPFHEKFVWAYLDVEEPVNRTLMQKYRVQGIPHITVLDKKGNIASHIRGALSPLEFASELEKASQEAE